MILYSASLSGFRSHVENNQITDEIASAFFQALGYRPGIGEMNAWNNSLRFMETATRLAELPDSCGVLIEYKIPSTSKRIDFMITGQDDKGRDNFVLVELKQWTEASRSATRNLVNTFVGRDWRDVAHPSQQAYSYCEFLSEMNEAIREQNIFGHACAYLHNYTKQNPEPLLAEEFTQITERVPVYFKSDSAELQKFLRRFLSRGHGENIKYYIENGRLKPSKQLIESLTSLFAGNKEFILLDEQIVAYETIMQKASEESDRKKVIVVEGGPGTGKSVVSMHVFRELIKQGKNVQFVAPNQAFRSVIIDKLFSGGYGTKGHIRNLFQGSGAFVNAPENFFDALVVDEAHRLKGEGTYQYRGISQVDDVMKSCRVAVFFVDDEQQIRPDDIGSTAEIYRCAAAYGAEVSQITLTAQFRCSGAEGYIRWLSDVLQLEQNANAEGWDQGDFVFEIFDNPHEVTGAIERHQAEGCNARTTAGYAWPWSTTGNNDAQIDDVVIEAFDFHRPWNTRLKSKIWARDEECAKQIGCIHTCQGLEFDYVGVIFGEDIRFDPVSGKIYADYKAYKDVTGKKNMQQDPEQLTQYIKNIYKVLCTRGLKGCYVYICDPELRAYFKARLAAARRNAQDAAYPLADEKLLWEAAEDEAGYDA